MDPKKTLTRKKSFTGSQMWFDDSKGWKSQQGGFSAVENTSTDANNMGGFFMRKLSGCTGIGLQLHKLVPIVFMTEAYGKKYRWILVAGALSNICLALFLASYMADLQNADAWQIPSIMVSVSLLEAFVMIVYASSIKTDEKVVAAAFSNGVSPDSLVSNIVARTVAIISTCILVYGIRDLWFTGTPIPLVPYDDLYLEWTNAFFHSPPESSPEYEEQGLGAGFYIGDKYICQMAGLQLTLLSLYKLLSSWTIRRGSDSKGEVTARMVWKPATIANLMLLFLLRIFASAGDSASWNVRWHLMVVAYETFIVGLYAFF